MGVWNSKIHHMILNLPNPYKPFINLQMQYFSVSGFANMDELTTNNYLEHHISVEKIQQYIYINGNTICSSFPPTINQTLHLTLHKLKTFHTSIFTKSKVFLFVSNNSRTVDLIFMLFSALCSYIIWPGFSLFY